ncbi:hypothetical protein MMC16_006759 [Acarospora aff. strigata]|nr:hypothetical protein [Acarospora aff. strigata]
MPVIIPYDLEQFVDQLVTDALDDAGISDGRSERTLIPIHEQGKGTAIIPDLPDTLDASGNLRVWVIGNELMWAGIDRRIDEVFELLWSLFHWHNSVTGYGFDVGLDQGDAVHHLARSFRQRLPPVLGLGKCSSADSGHMLEAESSNRAQSPVSKSNVVSPREAVLFKRWAFHTPELVNRNYNDYNAGSSLGFDEENILYPFPDDLFWKDGDEGEDDREGVPQWLDVGPTDDANRLAQEEKEEGRKRKRESRKLSQDLVAN